MIKLKIIEFLLNATLYLPVPTNWIVRIIDEKLKINEGEY